MNSDAAPDPAKARSASGWTCCADEVLLISQIALQKCTPLKTTALLTRSEVQHMHWRTKIPSLLRRLHLTLMRQRVTLEKRSKL